MSSVNRFRLQLLLLVLGVGLIFGLAYTAMAPAAGSAATVLIATGKVTAEHGGKSRPLVNHSPLYSGDTIVTGEGQVQLRFADGTMLTLYSNTRFAIDDYRYDGGGHRAHFSLLDGLMHTLTGNMDKQNYLLRTRLANLGVHGTDYLVQLHKQMLVSVRQGSVELTNAGGHLLVGAGKSALVPGVGVPPELSSKKVILPGGMRGGLRPGALGRLGGPGGPSLQGTAGLPGLPSGGGLPGGEGGAPPPPPGTHSLPDKLGQEIPTPPPPLPPPPPSP